MPTEHAETCYLRLTKHFLFQKCFCFKFCDGQIFYEYCFHISGSESLLHGFLHSLGRFLDRNVQCNSDSDNCQQQRYHCNIRKKETSEACSFLDLKPGHCGHIFGNLISFYLHFCQYPSTGSFAATRISMRRRFYRFCVYSYSCQHLTRENVCHFMVSPPSNTTLRFYTCVIGIPWVFGMLGVSYRLLFYLQLISRLGFLKPKTEKCKYFLCEEY